jgi:hypothetical protein
VSIKWKYEVETNLIQLLLPLRSSSSRSVANRQTRQYQQNVDCVEFLVRNAPHSTKLSVAKLVPHTFAPILVFIVAQLIMHTPVTFPISA